MVSNSDFEEDFLLFLLFKHFPPFSMFLLDGPCVHPQFHFFMFHQPKFQVLYTALFPMYTIEELSSNDVLFYIFGGS